MAMCNCMYPPSDPRCCMNRTRLRLTLSDHTMPSPPMPLEWWRQVYVSPFPYQPIPDYSNWWPLKEDKPAPDYNDDMRC